MKTAWPTRPLGEICDVQIGKTPTRSEPRFWGADHPWLSIRDMKQGRQLLETAESITDEAVREQKCRVVEPGTVLLSFKLSIGKVGIAQRPMYTNEAIAQLPLLAPDVDRDYLYWALRTVPLTAEVDRAAMGATLNKAKLQRIPIPVPPFKEQRRIAAVLDAADALRAERREALAKLDTLTQAIFIDMFGHPANSEDRWPTATLGELTQASRPICYGVLKPGPDVSGGVPLVRIVDLEGGQVRTDSLHRISDELDAEFSRSRLAGGEVLLSIQGTIGRVAICPPELAGANISRTVAVIRTDDRLTSRFLAAWLSMKSGRFETTGSTRSSLNIGTIRAMSVPVPPKAEQELFEARLDIVARVQAAIDESRRRLDDLFTSAQHRAFRGAL
jgi:type I restriction enzyme, S subunit